MSNPSLSHLDRLEAESIHILREVAAEFRNPVMLYSIGKDSSVLLHLLQKAFAPARSPIPLLHVDTGWKFREMIAFRDRRAQETGIPLRVHTNPDGVAQGIGPITHGGCDALCPSLHRGCFGCFGPSEAVNADALHAAWTEAGVSDGDWLRSLQTFNVAAPAFCSAAEGVAVQLRPELRDDGRR